MKREKQKFVSSIIKMLSHLNLLPKRFLRQQCLLIHLRDVKSQLVQVSPCLYLNFLIFFFIKPSKKPLVLQQQIYPLFLLQTPNFPVQSRRVSFVSCSMKCQHFRFRAISAVSQNILSKSSKSQRTKNDVSVVISVHAMEHLIQKSKS